MYLSNPTPTLLPQTLAWGSFKANDNQMPTLIFSNTLRLNFTGLTPNTAYNWTVKVQKGLPNASALDSNNFTTGAGETTKSLNIYLMAGLYNVGNTYFFGLAQAVAGGEEGIQFDFKIDNRVTLDTGGSTITGQLLNQAFSYSGQSFNVLTNRFLDELSLEKTNITVFTNAKIPTNLAVQTYVTSAISGKENTANKGVANGYASLDSDGKVPNSQIPLLAIKNVFPVSSQAQMLALTAQVGDMAIRSDLNKAFILKEEPASTLANWLEILTPVDQVLSVNGQTGAVSLSTANVSENTNLYFTEARVRDTPLTGFTATNTPITATDSVLVALGEAQGQINNRVSFSGNETIAGIKTFSSPVGVASPTAGGHATTRDYLDPANIIYAQIIIVRDRFLAEGLTFPNWKFYSLENLYRQIITATQSTILPDFLIMPNLSSDTSAPSSTRLINLGTGAANITINGSSVGVMIQPDHFLFDGVNDWLSSLVSQNGAGVGFTTHARVRSGVTALQNIFGSSTIEACFTSLVNGTFHIARSFDSNDGNGIGRGSSDFVINSDRKYSATYNGSNVVAGIKTYTNGVQSDSVNSNTGTFVSSRNTGAGNLVVGTRRNVDSYFSGRIYSAISWIGRELNYGQIQNINNLTVL